MKRLDAPSRAWVVRPFDSSAPGLRFKMREEDLRPGKDTIYDAEESEDSDDSDDDNDDESTEATSSTAGS